jgi:hypothetical protein
VEAIIKETINHSRLFNKKMNVIKQWQLGFPDALSSRTMALYCFGVYNSLAQARIVLKRKKKFI